MRNKMLEQAKNVFYKSKTMSYEQLAREYEFFVKLYPIVCNYMCCGMFDERLFEDLLRKKEKRPGFDESFKLQTEYLQQMFIKRGMSKMQAKKIANAELGKVETELNKIRKIEKQFKKNRQADRLQNAQERRKEFEQFLKENPKIDDPVTFTGAEWKSGSHSGYQPYMIQRGTEVEFITDDFEIEDGDVVFVLPVTR